MEAPILTGNRGLAAGVRGTLADARRRGVDFDVAWTEAVARALDAVGTRREREAWVEALAATRWAWEGAYTGAATAPRERAVRVINRYRELEKSQRSRFAVLA